jgi:hypothetical protein
MGNYKSPSIGIYEIDDSGYAITSSDTSVMVVGYATKGPIGEPVELTTKGEFLEMFGKPPLSAPWGHLAAQRLFNVTNKVQYLRVANEEGESAAVAAEKIITNSSNATFGYQEFSRLYPVAYSSYDKNELYEFEIEVDENGTKKKVIITSPGTGDWNLPNIANDINSELVKDTVAFQEFSAKTNPILTKVGEEYRFKASINGANLMSSTGGESEDFSVFLTIGDKLEDISQKMKLALEEGTNGYQNWEYDGVISDVDENTGNNLTPETEYNFNVSVDGGSIKEIVLTTPSGDAQTFTELAQAIEDAINSAIVADGSEVKVVVSNSGFRFLSKKRGTSSTIVVVDDNVAGDGTPLFNSLQTTSSLATPVDGGAGTAPGDATNGYDVSVNEDTGRVRLSSIAVGSSAFAEVFPPSVGKGLTEVLGVRLSSVPGTESITAICEIVSSKIRIVSQDEANKGTASKVLITAKTLSTTKSLITLLGTDEPVDGAGEVLQASTDNILIRAKDKGSDTNRIVVVKSSETNAITKEFDHSIEVYYEGLLQESFTDISLEVNSENFFSKVINSDHVNGGSKWISIEFSDNPVGSSDGIITFPDGTYQLGQGTVAYQDGFDINDYDYREGTDGVSESGGAGLFVEALDVSKELGNQEVYNFDILITPDNNSEVTQNAAEVLCNFRKDFVYIADPPFGLEYDEVVDWHNGEGGFGRNSALNNSYIATYWSWLKDYNQFTKEHFWQTPSAFLAEKFIETDNNFGPWASVAGDTRGRVIATEIEKSPSKVQRDILYNTSNRINPIVKFTGKGIVVYGQKTTLRSTSALSSLHVRRTAIYVKKLIKKAMEGFIFEAHTPETWGRAANYINSILESVRQKGGLETYSVRIDSSLNTEKEKSMGVMKGIIKIVPVGVIEHIDLKLSILNPGAEITE